jgi:hypothetical protein
MLGGSGGAGGRIALYSSTGSATVTGMISVAGGSRGFDSTGGSVATDGQLGTIFQGIVGGAINVAPTNGQVGVDIHMPALKWRSYGESASYPTSFDVYFGTSEVSMTLLRNVPMPTSFPDPNVPVVTTNTPELSILTGYFWRVDSKGSPSYGDVQGAVWQFTTRGIQCINRPIGDFNNDCRVTFADFAIFASQWGTCTRLPASNCN